jgi:hypothetical protein
VAEVTDHEESVAFVMSNCTFETNTGVLGVIGLFTATYVSITDCSFKHNKDGSDVIAQYGGMLNITNSIVEGNHDFQSTLSIVEGAVVHAEGDNFFSNTASSGGAIYCINDFNGVSSSDTTSEGVSVYVKSSHFKANNADAGERV